MKRRKRRVSLKRQVDEVLRGAKLRQVKGGRKGRKRGNFVYKGTHTKFVDLDE
jgi:hypothetical protein